MNKLPSIPPYEAIKWLMSRKPATQGKIFSQGDDVHPAGYNLYVGNLKDVSQIKIIQESLVRSLHKGLSFTHWQDVIKKKNIVLTDAEAIWRTNIFNALNQGRYTRFASSAKRRPYLLYESVEDSYTRHNHAANNGLCMRIDDPKWEGRVPPLGVACRCILLNLTEEEATQRHKFNVPTENGKADSEDWGHSPFSGITISI